MKPLFLTQEETEYLEMVLDNFPNDNQEELDSAIAIASKVYKIKNEFWNE